MCENPGDVRTVQESFEFVEFDLYEWMSYVSVHLFCGVCIERLTWFCD